jgi:hypothetical protein
MIWNKLRARVRRFLTRGSPQQETSLGIYTYHPEPIEKAYSSSVVGPGAGTPINPFTGRRDGDFLKPTPLGRKGDR